MFKKKILLFAIFLSCMFSFPFLLTSFAYSTNINDEASLLASEEMEKLQEQIDRVKEEYNLTIQLELIQNLGSASSPENYCETFFINNGNQDGALLLVAMDSRDVFLYVNGEVRSVISDTQLTRALKKITPYLSDAQYYKACSIYIDYMSAYYNPSLLSKMLFALQHYFIIYLIISVVIGGIFLFIFRAPIEKDSSLIVDHTTYLNHSNSEIPVRQDIFLRTTTTRTKIQRSSSGGGRSGGGVGGKF